MIIFSVWGFVGLMAVILMLVFVTAKQCQHNYTIMETVRLYDSDDSKRVSGFYFIQRCKKCGKVKRDKMVW